MKRIEIVILAIFIFTGCEPRYFIRKPASPGDTYYLQATYYGDAFNGKKTASGEIFDKNNMTCAAHGIPFGTMLLIENKDNGKSVIVKVTDRPGRNIIDLSEAAFKKISELEKGIIDIKIKVVDKKLISHTPHNNKKTQSSQPYNNNKTNDFYTIQLGAFTELNDAKVFSSYFEFSEIYIYVEKGDIDLYRVRVGRFENESDAKEFIDQNLKGRDTLIIHVQN